MPVVLLNLVTVGKVYTPVAIVVNSTKELLLILPRPLTQLCKPNTCCVQGILFVQVCVTICLKCQTKCGSDLQDVLHEKYKTQYRKILEFLGHKQRYSFHFCYRLTRDCLCRMLEVCNKNWVSSNQGTYGLFKMRTPPGTMQPWWFLNWLIHMFGYGPRFPQCLWGVMVVFVIFLLSSSCTVANSGT